MIPEFNWFLLAITQMAAMLLITAIRIFRTESLIRAIAGQAEAEPSSISGSRRRKSLGPRKLLKSVSVFSLPLNIVSAFLWRNHLAWNKEIQNG